MLSAVGTSLVRAVGVKLTLKQGPILQSARTLVQIQNKPYLPGSESPTFPKYLAEFTDDFPYKLYAPEVERKDLKAFAKEFRPTMDKHIAEHGAVLIKGLQLPTSADFTEFYHQLDLASMEYLGGSGFRNKVDHKVSSASLEPPEYNIEPHNEMSYLPYWPHLIFLYCEIQPEPGRGGESGITDVRKVYKALDKEVKEKVTRLGLRYHRYMPDRSQTDYTGWQDSYLTDSREEVEKILKENDQQFRWEEDGALSFWHDQAAMAPHYRTGEMLWFNQAHSTHWTYFRSHPTLGPMHKDSKEIHYPFTTFYGDGSDIEPEVLQHIREVSWECTVGGQLKQSDVLILDNMLMQHSRISFTGQRKLLVGLAQYKEYN